jgi:hypothetical protein
VLIPLVRSRTGKISLNGKGVGATGCVDCGKGRYSRSDHQGVCVDCEFGTFQNTNGQTACNVRSNFAPTLAHVLACPEPHIRPV